MTNVNADEDAVVVCNNSPGQIAEQETLDLRV